MGFLLVRELLEEPNTQKHEDFSLRQAQCFPTAAMGSKAVLILLCGSNRASGLCVSWCSV